MSARSTKDIEKAEARPLLNVDEEEDVSQPNSNESPATNEFPACIALSSLASSSSSTSSSPDNTVNSRDYCKHEIENNRTIAFRRTLRPVVYTKPPDICEPCSLGCLGRKHFLALLAVALMLLYLNSTMIRTEVDEQRIPVLHYSHVPGLRDGRHFVMQINSTPFAQHQLPVGTAVPRAAAVSTAAAATPPNAMLHEANASNDHSSSSYSHFHLSSSNASLSTSTSQSNIAVTTAHPSKPPAEYLVWSDNCKIANIDPYLPEMMKFFHRQKYTPCSSIKPLTHVQYNETAQRYVLSLNEDRVRSYDISGIVQCCYQSIERKATGVDADKHISFGKCIDFNKVAMLDPSIDNILVKCRNQQKQVYIDGHAMLPERKEIRERLESWHRKEAEGLQRPVSVLMIGIDTISRNNLIRAMPKTAQYLYDNEWFEMSGYNKIDDNTFPNIMAVLTGYNKTTALSKCSPTVLHGLDNCSFVWKTFREHGYVTAFGEDEAAMNTFNSLKVGFERPPVDYYLRPFLLGAEKQLHIRRKSGLAYCLGYKHSAEYVYDYALELATRYKDEPFFGLFWTNTFSHNELSDSSAMDEKMVDYLKKFSSGGTLENTIVVFFSDHGTRFGSPRPSLSGYLEERLPHMFLWLPQRLKQAHPSMVNALSVNKNRLTNPYDLHMTLKHVLALTGRVQQPELLQPAEGCPRCQTLLEPVPHNRSCAEIAIAPHWCTCVPYHAVYKNSKTVIKLAKAVVQHINEYVSSYQNGSVVNLCQKLQLQRVDHAYRADPLGTNQSTNGTIGEMYRIIFVTKPLGGLFEATAIQNGSSHEVMPQISRINWFYEDSKCIKSEAVKKFCACHKQKRS